MNQRTRTVCPHDCPSVCALAVEINEENMLGRVYGDKEHSYTQGVICAKVSRYAERLYSPDRVTAPLLRHGKKGAGLSSFKPISWDAALDIIAERFEGIKQQFGAEAIWPFHYAGTMGLVMRDGLDRFRHGYGTSRQHSTYCVTLSDAGWRAGTGFKDGADVRQLHKSELIVVWGGNPVSTQVNMMHHISQARRENGAKLVVIDPYRTKTADKADLHLMLKPGTDGALACAVMHVLLKEGIADQQYLAQFTDFNDDTAKHFESRTPAWAAAITGLSEQEIIEFARLYGSTKKSFIRVGYGFSRSRNGAVNMHAVSCLPAISGAWSDPAGGALYGHSDIYGVDKTLISGLDIPHQHTRVFDQSRIGAVLTGNPADLQGGPEVMAMLIQNTNPAVVAPDTNAVLKGLQREDLFTVVHEQFMTETALLADIVLPATMFVEHNDMYIASGHTHLQVGPKLLEPPGECRSNHQLLVDLSARLGLQHPANDMSDAELIDASLSLTGLPSFDTVIQQGGIDCATSVEESHFLNGFHTPDKRFHFAPDWSSVGPHTDGMPSMPDHWAVIDTVTEQRPLRLVTAPARQFLNTSFTETAGSVRMEKQPFALLHSKDIAQYQLNDGALVTLGNQQSEVTLMAKQFEGVQPGTVIVEGIWPNSAFAGGVGINSLVSAEPAQPNGGAVFHDTAVWVRVHAD